MTEHFVFPLFAKEENHASLRGFVIDNHALEKELKIWH